MRRSAGVVASRSLLAEALARWGRPQVVDGVTVGGRRNYASTLEAVGFPAAALVVRGHGIQGRRGPTCGRSAAAVLGGHVRPANSLLLTSAMA